ncbi:hypothetical protein BCY91_09385 [Pelobium manganitolerans]|uniref:Uncharacterized protein n=1 Tax=Pelobium manganitolerans TaxID=1842495 RepID=A0A419S3A9_9SPHI|nr:hypothetical protein [Pelobium manganitolerans]RKD13766.1 hypothetical protein BCY91_09385 [Pelobium manganitolerans]
MTYAEKHILETYSTIFENLSFKSKVKLLQKMVTALKAEVPRQKKDFFTSFGAFAPNKTAEEIVKEIKKSRSFKDKDLYL